MVKAHLKRIAAPKTWPLKRKKAVWNIRPNAGPHTLATCLPLGMFVRDVLKHAKTMKEVRTILNHKHVLVNKKQIKDPKHPVGIFDTLEFPDIKESYRIIFNAKGRIAALKTDDVAVRPCKIKGKHSYDGKVQVTFYDGTNTLVEKGTKYKVGDTVVVDLQTKSLKDHYSFEKGALVYLMSGKYIGKTGKLDEIKSDRIVFTLGKDKVETLKEYAFVIGKDKPSIKTE